MDTPPRFHVYVSGGREPVDVLDDYDEAVAQCRALVEEDGHARAEVRHGTLVCCAADRDQAGRLRLLDAGDGPVPRRERDVTHRLRPSSREDGTDDRGSARRALFLGEDHAGPPTRWLGL